MLTWKKKKKKRRIPGPDWITGKLLKVCADKLCAIFPKLFNLSIEQPSFPQLWKGFIRTNPPKSSMTPLVMKSFERLFKQQLVKVGHKWTPVP